MSSQFDERGYIIYLLSKEIMYRYHLKTLTREVPFILILFWIFIILLQNKEIDLFTLNIHGLPFRFTHIIIILLSLFSIPNFRFADIKNNLSFFLFNLLGIIILTQSFPGDMRFILSTYGMFFYSFFYYFSYQFFNESIDSLILAKSTVLFTLLGILNFIGKYVYYNHSLPIGQHLSSDVLPLISAVSIFLIWGFELHREIFYKILIYLFLSFIILVKIKGTLVALLLSYFFYRSQSKGKIFIALSCALLLFVSVKFYLPFNFFTTIFLMIKNLTGIDIGSLFPFGVRLVMWDEVTNRIITHLFLGNKFVSFDCPNINLYWQNAFGVSASNINPHNSFLYLVFLGGVTGLMLFLKNIFDLNFLYKIFQVEEEAFLTIIFLFCISFCLAPILEIYYVGPLIWICIGALKARSLFSFELKNKKLL